MSAWDYTTPEGHTYTAPTTPDELRALATTYAQGVIEDWDELELPPEPTWEMIGLALGEFMRSGLSAHLSPGKRWLHSPHDKNSVHMDGCIPLYVKRSDLSAHGADLEGWH